MAIIRRYSLKIIIRLNFKFLGMERNLKHTFPSLPKVLYLYQSSRQGSSGSTSQ